jgi:hypothetical protein
MRSEIWLFQNGIYAVHITDSKLKNKFDFLKNFKLITTYFYPNGVKGWDYLIPAEMYKKVKRWLKPEVNHD